MFKKYQNAFNYANITFRTSKLHKSIKHNCTRTMTFLKKEKNSYLKTESTPMNA